MNDLKELLNYKARQGVDREKIVEILRTIIHSDVLAEIVASSKTPVDDMILRILKLIVPQK